MMYKQRLKKLNLQKGELKEVDLREMGQNINQSAF